MKYLTLILLIFFTYDSMGQKAKFTITLESGSISGKKLKFTEKKIELNIADSGVAKKVGTNANDESISIKCYLLKESGNDGSRYYPVVLFYLSGTQCEGRPVIAPRSEQFLSQEMKFVRIGNSSLEVGKDKEGGYEMHYQYTVDGRNLDYKEKYLVNDASLKIDLFIESLMINGQTIKEDKHIKLINKGTERKVTIAEYNKKPVYIVYSFIFTKDIDGEHVWVTLAFNYTSKQNTDERLVIPAVPSVSEGNKISSSSTTTGMETSFECSYNLAKWVAEEDQD
jgi:hypothetical protein